MTEEMIMDIENRINVIVNRYRETTGRYKDRLKLKLIDNKGILSDPGFYVGLAILAVAFIVIAPDEIVRLIGIGLLVALPFFILITGSIERVKIWEDDNVSEADLLYLCENEFLKERILIILGDKDGIVTYNNLEENITRFTRDARGRMEAQLRNDLIQKAKDVDPTIK